MSEATLDPVKNAVGGIGDMIVTAIERHGPRIAFIANDREVTFQAFGADIAWTIQALHGLGMRAGGAVLQLASNSYDLVVVMTACYVGGFVSVTPHYAASLDDHRHVLDDSDAVLLVVDAPRADRGRALMAGRSGLRVVCHAAGTGLPELWPAGASPPRQAGLAPRLKAADCPQDMVRLIYTGGTTGLPKGVITLSSQLAFASLLHVAEQGFSTATRLVVLSPISHGAGSFILPVLVKGGSVVIHDGFDVAAVIDAVERLRATALFLVPTMLYVLMDDPRLAAADLSSLARIIYAASSIATPRLEQALRLFGPILSQNYGLTEVPGTVLTLTPEDHVDPRASRLTAAGKPYPGVTVRLLDDAGSLVDPGMVGEICVRAPHATPGYWKRPHETALLWEGGWLHTGDMARQDADGYFHVVDRKKDMIVSGGFNVYPQTIEQRLGSHPAVAAAAVIGVPHQKWGEAVHAIVVLNPGQAASPETLIAFLKEHDGAVTAPKTVAFVDALPLTALGKVDKKRLRAPFWSKEGRNVA